MSSSPSQPPAAPRRQADTHTQDLFTALPGPPTASTSTSTSACASAPAAAPPPASPDPITASDALHLLHQWADAGLLRHLDVALARFIHHHDPQAPACVLVAACVLAHMEGRGHSCLALHDLIHHPAAILGWPTQPAAADHIPALHHLWQRLPTTLPGWLHALAHCGLVTPVPAPNVTADPGPTTLASPPTGQPPVRPLVLTGWGKSAHPATALLYLRRYWDYEHTVARHILHRTRDHPPPDEALLRYWLDQLFPAPSSLPAATTAPPATFDWQKLACALALRGRLTIITGGPGTGKTYTAARLLALLFATSAPTDTSAPFATSPLRVALAAPTGKAAARLKQSIASALHSLHTTLHPSSPRASDPPASVDLPALMQHLGAARTLHALLGARPGTRHLLHNAARPLDVDVLIVDEASMIHLEMMAALLEALPAQARLILLGDKDQLASVEAGAVLGDLCHNAQAGHYSPATIAWAARVTGQHIPAAYHFAPAHTPVAPAPSSAPSPTPPAAPVLAQHTVMLRDSRRFSGPIGQLAAAVNTGQAAQALGLLHQFPALCPPSSPTLPTTGHPSPPAEICLHTGTPPGHSSAPPSTAAAHIATALALHGRNGQGLCDPQRPQAPVTASYASYAQALARWPTIRAAIHATPSQATALHTAWVQEVIAAFERFRLLCAVREGEWGVTGLNHAIERALAANGTITPSARSHGSESGSSKSGGWYMGRPVMVTRNDTALGVFNGDIGITLPAAPPPVPPSGPTSTAPGLRVYFQDGDTLRSIATARLAHVETAFAMTVHKSQGSEFEHTAVLLPPQPGALGRELLYTGITRARRHFTLLAPYPGLLEHAIANPTRRASGLRQLLGHQ